MTIATGSRLGPYEVVAPLGAGGMGEVWRARDPRLSRDVAIKALPAAFAQDPDRLARFEREARLLASLSHPNIAGIHGIEDVGGARYLVLEFVDGETLEARIKRGALPLDDVLDVAQQVAAGVEAAHEAGVIHRDLKPGNIMITSNGSVKVLDFGLAKGGATRGASGSDPNLSASPTMTAMAGSEMGVILGTAAYMSPEQARGRTLDRRTDIWSFGCVLFEMLAGKRVYDGETVSDMVARILEREPDWSALPTGTPPRLLALLKRCLAKDAKKRLRDIGEARLELEAIAAGDRGDVASTAAPAARGVPAWAFAAGAAALLAIGAAVAWFAPHAAAQPARALTVLAPMGVAFGPLPTDIAISPDGRQLAFVGSDTLSGARLWLRPLDRDGARSLEGTDGAQFPFWSPDSRSVGFFAGGKLKVLELASGTLRTLADAPLPRGGGWGKGVIVYQPRSLGPLWSVPEQGGDPVVVTSVDTINGEGGHRFPSFLPDGRHFVFMALGRGFEHIDVGAIGEHTVKLLLSEKNGRFGAVYSPPGWLLLVRDGAVRAQRFDPGRLVLSGPAIEVPGVRAFQALAAGAPVVSVSANGVLVQRAAADMPQRLAVIDRAGHVTSELQAPEGTYRMGSLSPDGRRAVFEHGSFEATNETWLADLDRGTMQPLTEGGGAAPTFSPDGQTLALQRGDTPGSRANLYTLRIDAPGSLRRVHRNGAGFFSPLGWAPDGHGVLMRVQGTDTRQDLYFADLTTNDSTPLMPVMTTRFNEPTGAISPDGHWLAYLSDATGRPECHVHAFPAADGPDQVVSRGAWAHVESGSRVGTPVWRRDGRELLYVGADGHTLEVVNVTPGNPPVFSEPRPLFRMPQATMDMAVSPGLDRFVLSIAREEEGRSSVTVLLDWQKLIEGSPR
jgi:Tol biopolymer transport system component/tRNA A-37 threonylcarbamoyl transferase component Bud32